MDSILPFSDFWNWDTWLEAPSKIAIFKIWAIWLLSQIERKSWGLKLQGLHRRNEEREADSPSSWDDKMQITTLSCLCKVLVLVSSKYFLNWFYFIEWKSHKARGWEHIKSIEINWCKITKTPKNKNNNKGTRKVLIWKNDMNER